MWTTETSAPYGHGYNLALQQERPVGQDHLHLPQQLHDLGEEPDRAGGELYMAQAD